LSQNVISLTSIGPVGERIAKLGIRVDALGVNATRPSPSALTKLVDLLRELHPDLLQTWLYHADLVGIAAGCLAGVPHIVWNLRCTDLNPRDLRFAQRLVI